VIECVVRLKLIMLQFCEIWMLYHFYVYI